MKRVKLEQREILAKSDKDTVYAILKERHNKMVSTILTFLEETMENRDRFKKARKIVLDNTNDFLRLVELFLSEKVVLEIKDIEEKNG